MSSERWRTLEIRIGRVLYALSDEPAPYLRDKREKELRQYADLIEYVHKQFEEQEQRQQLMRELRQMQGAWFERDGYEGGYGNIRFEWGRRRKKPRVTSTGVK